MGKIMNEAEDVRKTVHQHWLRHVVHLFFTNASAPVTSTTSAFGKVAIFKSKPCPQTLHFKSHSETYPDFKEV